MSVLNRLLSFIPDVQKPVRKLSFDEKLKWTVITLLLYFVLAQIPLWGLDPRWTVDYFEAVRAIIAGKFGSIITLGIGPIVTAGIILQLLVGVELLPIDLNTQEGRQTFQGLEQLLTIFIALFEAVVYVFMGGLPAVNNMFSIKLLLVLQLFMGSMLIFLLDGLSQKWGFISGISLFIAAGVSSEMMVATLNPLPSPRNPLVPAGRIPASIHYMIGGDPRSAAIVMVPVLFTILVFLITVYTQSINVEIPLTFGRVGGIVTRWPLNLFYTGNTPVILVAALLANMQLWARLLQKAGITLLGMVDASNQVVGGVLYFLTPPSDLIYYLLSPVSFFNGVGGDIHQLIYGSPLGPVSIYKLFYLSMLLRAFCYMVFMVAGCVLFSVFWVKSAGQDSESVAEQISSAGMFRQGFRSDPRIMKLVLDRYIPQLTVIGGAAVGLLATFAEFTGAIGGGTGILLAVMIIYRLYEVVVREHFMDMTPVLKKFVARE